MATLFDTTINGTLTLIGNGYITLPKKSVSWLQGFQQSPIQISDATDNGGYHPWIIQKNTSAAKMFTMGIYQDYFIMAGSTTSRTSNGYDNALFFNIANGELKLNNSYLYLHSNNYNKYAPTKTGSGASGTWNINISGTSKTITNVLPVSKGGTGNSSFDSSKLLYYNGSKIVTLKSSRLSTSVIGLVATTDDTVRIYTQNRYNNAEIRTSTAAGVYHSNATGSKTAKWLIHINTSGTVTANTSDRRKKKYIEDTTEYEAISILKNIKIRNFIYKEDIGYNNLVQNGIFAQDLRDIMKYYNISNRPWLQWHYNNDDNVYYDINEPETDNMTYEINYSSLIPLLIKGWQINENKISQLKNKIKELEEM